MKNKLIVSFLLLMLCFVGFAQINPDFFLNNWEAKTIENPNGFLLPQTENPHEINVVVNVRDSIRKVSKYLFGGNLNVYSPLFTKHPEYVDDLKNLSPNVLRWPGGNGSNEYFWNATSTTLPADLPPHNKLGPSTQGSYWAGKKPGTSFSLDEYYSLLETTNSTGCICVNYSYARYGLSENPVAVAAKLAADWVRYDNGRTKFWEIGNENFGNWQTGYTIDPSLYSDKRPEKISGKIYGEHCKVFIDSMRAAANEIGVEIFIGVQGWESFTSWDPVQTAWNDGVFSEVGGLADFVVVHNYYTEYKQNSTIEQIFATRKKTYEFPHVISTKLKEHGHQPLPIALTEYNTQARENGQLISYINGMHAIMVLGDAIRLGYGMANRWSTVGYWSAPGGMGTFSYAGQPGVPEGDMRPDFYYLYYFQKLFGDVMVSSTSSDSAKVFSFASTYSSGQCGLVLFNKTSNKKTIKVDLQNFEKGSKYHYYVLTGGTDNSPFSGRVYVNGNGTKYEKGGPAETYDKIKPYTTNYSDEIKIDAPAYSVIFMIVEGKDVSQFKSASFKQPSEIELVLSSPLSEVLAKEAFNVNVNGSRVGINQITNNASGANLVLSIDTILTNTDVVTLTYNGGDVNNDMILMPFNNKPVMNMLVGAAPFPLYANVIDSLTVNIAFSKNISSVDSYSFNLVEISSEPNSVGIDAIKLNSTDSSIVEIQTSNLLKFTQNLEVVYSGNSIKSADGGTLQPFVLEVKNSLKPKEIVLDSAFTDRSGECIKVFCSQPMNGAFQQESYFSVSVNGNPVGVNLVATSESIINVYLSEELKGSQQVLLSYSGGIINSVYGESLPYFMDLEIENRVLEKPKYIKNVKVNGSTSGFEIDIAKDGVLVFTDRSYVFSNLPDSIQNSEFIRWSMGLKSTYNSKLLTFEIDTSGIVYIAHDNRLKKPDWLLENYIKTNISFNLAQSDAATLYYKEFVKGSKVVLGENQIKGTETGTSFNYVAFFKEKLVENTSNNSSFYSKDMELDVFPNPAVDVLHVRIPKNASSILSIYNVIGKEVYSNNCITGLLTIDIAGFKPGIYKVLCRTGNELLTKSIIIQ